MPPDRWIEGVINFTEEGGMETEMRETGWQGESLCETGVESLPHLNNRGMCCRAVQEPNPEGLHAVQVEKRIEEGETPKLLRSRAVISREASVPPAQRPTALVLCGLDP